MSRAETFSFPAPFSRPVSMVSKAVLLATLLVLGTLAFAPAVAPASAFHVCVTEPCDHGLLDQKPFFMLLCKVTQGGWSPNCGW